MFSQGKLFPTSRPTSPWILRTLIFSLLVLTLACGGSGGGGLSGSPEPPPVAPTTAAQFKIGDATSDRLLSVEATITALHLINAHGDSINILPSSRQLEFNHLAGTSQLIAQLQVPQGTYNQALFDGADLHVTYLDYAGQWQEYIFSGTTQFTVPLPPLVIGASSTVVSVDFDLARSITVDPTNATEPEVNPVLTFSTASVASSQQQPEDGALENVSGLVTRVSGTTFDLTAGRDNFTLTLNTDSHTEFDNVSLGTLLQMLVQVEGTTQPDGSLLATKVQAWADQNGAQIDGLVTMYYNYVTSEGIVVLAQDAVGNGFFAKEDVIGRTARASVMHAAYDINTDGMDMTGINYQFNPHTAPGSLDHGQRVRLQSLTGFARGDPQFTEELDALKVILEKQAITGTVQNYTPGNPIHFDLILDAGSYLSIMRHVSTIAVDVVQQPGTHLHGITSVNNGDVVRVRGLLFSDYETGLHMVAQRIWQ